MTFETCFRKSETLFVAITRFALCVHVHLKSFITNELVRLRIFSANQTSTGEAMLWIKYEIHQ